MSRFGWVCSVLVGCAGSLGGEEGVGSDRQWLCESDGELVTCSAAIPTGPGEDGAYACRPGESRESCPPEAALDPVRDEIGDSALVEAFDRLPWACLLTGAHLRDCSRSLERARAALPPETRPAEEPPVEEPPAEEPPATEPVDEFGPAEIPGDCTPATWEAYFCAHATHSYRSHGVDITFPCEVFDAGAALTDSAFTRIGAESGPSCHDGEWAMRQQAWLDAVGAGCMDLSSEILVLCQQAADYAPTTGACAATGTW